MKSLQRISVSLLSVLCLAVSAFAQIDTPRPSPKASVTQRIGVTDVTITYSRPGVKGRKIWGDPLPEQAATKGEATLDNQNERPKGAPIVPWGHVWRTGANEATQFVVTDDVLINGQKLAAGSYSLHTIPGKDEWTIIFNSDAGQWGSFSYDEKKDALRVKVKPQTASENREWLTYSIPVVTPDSAQVVIHWEKLMIPFAVEIPSVEALSKAKIDALVAANPGDWKLLLNVANQYAGNDRLDEALKWVEQSIKAKEAFQNLSMKAMLLIASGRKDEAFSIAERAIRQGKADNVDTARFERRIADLKAAKQ